MGNINLKARSMAKLKGVLAAITLVTAVASPGCSTATRGQSSEPRAADAYFSNWPAGSSPRDIGKRLAENWLERPFGFQATSEPSRYGSFVSYSEVNTEYGALRVAAVTGDSALLQRLIRKFDYFLTPEGAKRISQEAHVDFRVFGAVPLEIYIQTHDPKYLDLGRSFADRQWENTTSDGISREARYWVDDMYMLTLLQLEAYRATNNRVYLDRTALTMVAYLDSLQQPNGLFYHGPGTPFYWGRGNGWIAAGMTELLLSLPADHPRRAKVLAGYRRMMATLLLHQSPEGLWRQLIDKPELWTESSGSGMLAYAMITGVREGWLDAATYGPAARRAWLALVNELDANANVRDICVGTGTAESQVGNDIGAQYRYYAARERRTGDTHGQAPALWAAAALLH
jgi:rhamnogalacturonyl hydrolase YesR